MSIDEDFFKNIKAFKVIKNSFSSMNSEQKSNVYKGATLSIGVAIMAFTLFSGGSSNDVEQEIIKPEFVFSSFAEREINLSASLKKNEVKHFYGETEDMPTIEVISSGDTETIKINSRVSEIKEKIKNKNKQMVFDELTLNGLKKPNKKYLSKDNLGKEDISLEDIDKIGNEYGLPDKLLSSIYLIETRGNCDLESNKNAVGCFQFLSETAKMFGLKGSGFDYRKNIIPSADASARYLAWLFKYLEREIGQDEKWNVNDLAKWSKVVGAYNAGPKIAVRYKDRVIHPYKETRDYIKNVMMLTSGNGHWVKPGERIENISEKYGVEPTEIVAMNGGITNQSMKYGTVLKISDPQKVGINITVEEGDTLYRIALASKTTVDYLKKYNGLDDNNIQVGQNLKIPVDAVKNRSSSITKN